MVAAITEIKLEATLNTQLGTMALTKLVQALLASIILATTTSATRFALPIVPAPEESVLFGSIDIGHKLNNASIAGNGTFQQYIDHWNHSLGTFSQFYYYNATFWKPGGPVSADSSLKSRIGETKSTGRRMGSTRNRPGWVSAIAQHQLHDGSLRRSYRGCCHLD